jgi:hypothetical protein
MREVLTPLGPGTDDPWAWAQWLNTPVPDRAHPAAGEPPRHRNIERLFDGQANGVLAAAERTASGWAS